MKTSPLSRRAGIVMPSITATVLIWLPVLLAKALFTAENGRPPIGLSTVLMPLVAWTLWRVFLADCRWIAQRTLIPVLTLALVWVAGPLVMFGDRAPLLLMLDPMSLLIFPMMAAGYSGTLFGLAGVVGVALIALLRGAAPTPPELDADPRGDTADDAHLDEAPASPPAR